MIGCSSVVCYGILVLLQNLHSVGQQTNVTTESRPIIRDDVKVCMSLCVI